MSVTKVLHDGESLNGFNGNLNPRKNYTGPDPLNDTLIEIDGDHTTVENVTLFPARSGITAIRILPGHHDCTIKNVLITPYNGLVFENGIEICENQSGHNLNHIQMVWGCVKKGIIMKGGYVENVSIVNTGIELVNRSDALRGFELNGTYNNLLIAANTWFHKDAVNAGGLYLDGLLTNSTIKHTTEMEGDGGPAGYTMQLGDYGCIPTGNHIYNGKVGNVAVNPIIENVHNIEV
jgi:hypothetical protein